MNDSSTSKERLQQDSLRERVWRIIFQTESGTAKAFDILLLVIISTSVMVIMLESVESIETEHRRLLKTLEWLFTILFTIEYTIRVIVVRKRHRYIFSFFGIVDLLSILPTYLELFIAGSGHFIVLRTLRLLRMFRILKMVQYVGNANVLLNALKASRPKIAVFIFGLFVIVGIQGTLMYIVEGQVPGTGFTSIPQSIYWGFVTITTVGYGDIVPTTVLGKIIASVIMVTGFAIIAVPTGIVTAELHRELEEIKPDTRTCEACGHEGHDPKAFHCKMCGQKL
jgi:voltage-gated potassium channel